MLQTAVLDRSLRALCEALLAGESPPDSHSSDSLAARSPSQVLLERLEAANLFITSLDEKRQWYRYHNLFAGLLRARLQQTAPHQVVQMHRRAARWLAGQGLVEEAISHALEAGDFDLAADLLEREGIDLVSRHKMVSLARWLETLPQATIEKRPWLCIFMAYTRHWLGDRQHALGACLEQAERAMAITPPAGESESRRIRGYIASLRAQDVLSARNPAARIIEQANLALELLPPGDLMGTEAGVSLGGAYWIQGDAQASERAFAAGRDTAIRNGKYLMAVPTATYAAWQQMKQGRLQEALDDFERRARLGHADTGTPRARRRLSPAAHLRFAVRVGRSGGGAGHGAQQGRGAVPALEPGRCCRRRACDLAHCAWRRRGGRCRLAQYAAGRRGGPQQPP